MKYTVIDPGLPEPMPPGGILRTTFRVGYRSRCIMTMDISSLAAGPAAGTLNAQWEPSLPTGLSRAECATTTPAEMPSSREQQAS